MSSRKSSPRRPPNKFVLSPEAMGLSSASSGVNQRYAKNPVLYAKEVLGIKYIAPKVEQVMMSVATKFKPHMIKSGHSYGKTNLMAMLTNWHYDTFNPSLTITTAPSKRDVEDLLWKEVRMQRLRAGLSDDFIGPSAPEMRTAPDHYAKGFTAGKGESFQGRHDEHMMFAFDEAIGIDVTFWQTTKTMYKPEQGHFWVAIFNPTCTTSQAWIEEDGGGWEVFSLSSLEHPNIALELSGKPPIIPAAVTRSQIDTWVKDWTVPINFDERRATDIQWPPTVACPCCQGKGTVE